jgi:hypothetical protein
VLVSLAVIAIVTHKIELHCRRRRVDPLADVPTPMYKVPPVPVLAAGLGPAQEREARSTGRTIARSS